MENITVGVESVKIQLISLNPNNATGPDEVGPCMLKEMAEVLAAPSATLTQTSLEKRSHS